VEGKVLEQLSIESPDSDYITRLDDGGSTFVTPDLCSAILDDRKTFADTATDLKDSYDAIETRAIAAYYYFVADEEEKLKSPNDTPVTMDAHFPVVKQKRRLSPNQKWPDFDTETFCNTLGFFQGKMQSGLFLTKPPTSLRNFFSGIFSQDYRDAYYGGMEHSIL
jgi:hypothetical protein